MVAIKQASVRGLAPDEQQQARRWLAREAGLLSSLDHPLLPNLVAAFSEGDEHYVVMPFLEGTTLKELVGQTGPLQYAEVIRWTRDLTELLIYLHSQDPPIIHRDLKPDNVLIMPNHQLVVLDLSAARPPARGLPGTSIGTPGYAAPEQYQGLADERSDLYALGATLHYMLTGYDAEQEPPFQHPPVRQINPKLGPGIEALVAKLQQLAPDARPQSATVLADYLDAFERYQQCMAPIAYYRWNRRRLMSRGLPITLASLGVAAIVSMNPLGFPIWLQSMLNWVSPTFLASYCLSSAVYALRLPSFAASALRNDAGQARRAQLYPILLVAFGLAMCYTFALSRAVQWILLPALLILPHLVVAAGWGIAGARARRAGRSLETVMNMRLSYVDVGK